MTEKFTFRRKIVLICFLAVFLLSSNVMAENGQIENLNFREAKITEVLETLSEIAEVNLVVDSSVEGEITIRLHEVGFDEALGMVTKSHDLDYTRKGDVVIVASPERIKEVYSEEIFEVLPVKDRDPDEIQEMLQSIFTEINIEQNKAKSQLVLAGGEAEINRSLTLLDQLDFSSRSEEKIEITEVDEANVSQMTTVVEGLFPDLKVIANEPQNQLILQGKSSLISEARQIIEEMNVSEKEQIIEIISVNADDLDTIIEIVQDIYPEVKMKKQAERKRIIVYGEGHIVDESIKLIKNLDVKEESSGQDDDSGDQDLQEKVSTKKIENGDLDNIAEVLSSIYPELVVEKSSANSKLILKGADVYLEGAFELIDELDETPETVDQGEQGEEETDSMVEDEKTSSERSERTEETEARKEETSNINIKYRDIEEVRDLIEEAISGIEVTVDDANQQLFISGLSDDVDRALEMAEKLDLEEKKETEVVTLNYMDLDTAANVLTGSFDDEINVQKNEDYFQLILKGRTPKIKEAKNLVASMDLPRKQVLIEARVEEISHNDIKRLGFDADLGNISFLQGEDFNLPRLLDLMKQKSGTETLASPRLMTLSGENARLLIGDRVTFKVNEGREDEGVETLEAGINLDFTPRVGKNNDVTLEVKPEISSFTSRSGAEIPDVNTREAETTIRLKDGETFVIGGLIQDEEIESVSEVPLLSKLPIAGELFKHRETNTEKSELLIIITPYILGEDGLSDANMKNKDDIYFFDQENKQNDEESKDNSSGIEIEGSKIESAEVTDKKNKNFTVEYSDSYYELYQKESKDQ
ncbi:MAG: hypothetical protein ACOCQ1_01640 [Halanaerobiaceae bacterium]